MEIMIPKINSNGASSRGSKFNRIERIFTQDRTMRTGTFRVTRSARLLPVQEIQWASNKHFRFRNDAFEEADGACKVMHSTGWRWLLCAPDTKRAPPLVRLRKATRVCLPFFSILTARPSILSRQIFRPLSSLLHPHKSNEQEESRVGIFFHVVHEVQSPISTPTTNGISFFFRNSPVWIPGTRLRHDSKSQDVDS